MAVLVDEYGGMAGILTQEDLVEEIVGELDDELDTDPDDIRPIDRRHAEVEGGARIEDVNDELSLEMPAGEYETIAGFMLERLGRLPVEGEVVQWNGLTLTVLEMQGPRIARVDICRRERQTMNDGPHPLIRPPLPLQATGEGSLGFDSPSPVRQHGRGG